MSGSAFTVWAVAVRDGMPVSLAERATRIVAINGGVEGPFAPAVTAVRPVRADGGVEVEVSGAMLGTVRDLRLLTTDMNVIVPDWSRTETGSLRFWLANDVAMRVRFVQVRDSAGRGSVEPCDTRAEVHPPVKNQVLARLREGYTVTSLGALKDLADDVKSVGWTVPHSRVGQARNEERYPDFALVNPSAAATIPELLNRVRAQPGVASADSLTEGQLLSTPTDPRWKYQWTLRTSALPYCNGTINGPMPPLVSGGSVNANLAWDYPANGPPVGIGVVDSGINGNHEDFFGVLSGLPHMRSTLTPGFNAAIDPYPLLDSAAPLNTGGHGTPVAGIAAGVTGFEEPYSPGVGTASASRYGLPVSLKCYFTNGATIVGMAEALDAVVQHSNLIRVANVSLGFNTPSPTERALLASTLRRAFLGGSLIVAAIGNDGATVAKFPAALSDLVVAVGAVDWNNSRWLNSSTLQPHCSVVPFPIHGSSSGPWLDLMAPGGVAVHAPSGSGSNQELVPVQLGCNLCLSYPNSNISGFGGTSAAAPVVSGAAAWLLHVMPDLTAEDAGEVLRRSATDVGPQGFDIFYGHGSIDMWEATKFLSVCRMMGPPQGQLCRIIPPL